VAVNDSREGVTQVKPGSQGAFVTEEGWQALLDHALTPYLVHDGGLRLIRPFNYSPPREGGKIYLYAIRNEPLCEMLSRSKSFNEYIEEITAPESEFIYHAKQYALSDAEVWESTGYRLWLDRGKTAEAFRCNLFKTGLSGYTARQRHRTTEEVYFEKEISNPLGKTESIQGSRAAQIETLVRFALFFKYWKELSWFVSPQDAFIPDYIGQYFQAFHLKVGSPRSGIRESWAIRDIEKKVEIAVNCFDLVNAFTEKEMQQACIEIRMYRDAWMEVSNFKQRIASFLLPGSRLYINEHPGLFAERCTQFFEIVERWNPIPTWLNRNGFREAWVERSEEELRSLLLRNPMELDICPIPRKWLNMKVECL